MSPLALPNKRNIGQFSRASEDVSKIQTCLKLNFQINARIVKRISVKKKKQPGLTNFTKSSNSNFFNQFRRNYSFDYRATVIFCYDTHLHN